MMRRAKPRLFLDGSCFPGVFYGVYPDEAKRSLGPRYKNEPPGDEPGVCIFILNSVHFSKIIFFVSTNLLLGSPTATASIR